MIPLVGNDIIHSAAEARSELAISFPTCPADFVFFLNGENNINHTVLVVYDIE